MKKKIAHLISLNSDMSDKVLSQYLTMNCFLPVKAEVVFGTHSSIKRTYKVCIRFLFIQYTFFVSLDYDAKSYIHALKRYNKVERYHIFKRKS